MVVRMDMFADQSVDFFIGSLDKGSLDPCAHWLPRLRLIPSSVSVFADFHATRSYLLYWLSSPQLGFYVLAFFVLCDGILLILAC